MRLLMRIRIDQMLVISVLRGMLGRIIVLLCFVFFMLVWGGRE